MASAEVPKIIMFCDKCKKRKGPVSATHRGCGGDEANCTCEEEVAVPESQESDSVHRSPLRDESDDDSKADAPSTAEKQPTGGYLGKRLLTPAQEAAVIVRRCAVKFQTLGLDFPKCMTKIAHLNPHTIMKELKLDDCETRTASINWKVAANVKMQEGAVRNCAQKALVKYEKRCPDCFNPFAAAEYAPELSTEEMDKEQIWWLMTKEQRLAILLDEARALQERKAVNLKHKASGDWYQSCISTIRQGSNAIKEHMRFSQKKRKISDYLQTARNHLAPKKSKAEVDTITNNLLQDVDIDEFAEDSDF